MDKEGWEEETLVSSDPIFNPPFYVSIFSVNLLTNGSDTQGRMQLSPLVIYVS
jgi:hypothetical protein